MGSQHYNTLYNGTFELSLEAYYKTMKDLIAYKAGYSNLESSEAWQNAIEIGGEGESYGLSCFYKRRKVKPVDGLVIHFRGQIEGLRI